MTDLDPEPRPTRTRLDGLSIELPAQGTGIRAARRAAREQAEREAAARDGLRRDAGRERVPAEPEPPRVRRAPVPQPAPRGPSGRWLAGFAALLVACCLVAAGLLVLGVVTLKDSRAGRTVVSATPEEPGYEAFLDPTPTMAVVYVHEGRLESAALLSLGLRDTGGGVLVVPPDTQIGDGQLGTLALARIFGADLDQMRGAVEAVTGVGIPEIVELDDARWAELLAPIGALTFENPDDLPGFPRGPLTLAADQVGPYLRARADEESDLNRQSRHELVWEAWLSAVGDRPDAVPGEHDVGLGRFVRGLAVGPRRVTTLPVEPIPQEDGSLVFAADEADREATIAALVPYPTGTANAPRTLVRVLDGTGETAAIARHAPAIVSARSSIVVIGNADRFGYERTEIRYHRPELRAEAERLRAALGKGEVIEDVRPIDTFGVTIVLGTDLEEQS